MNEGLRHKGKIFNIQRFSTHDGPGIRTTVFMKGCALRCFWCQNPESQRIEPELLHNAEDCVACGRCASVCRIGAVKQGTAKAEVDRSRCTGCGDCIAACPEDSFSVAGKDMTVDEVLSELLKDRTQYLNSGGGVTLSGGDPLFQHVFSSALLKACKAKGLHTLAETCGYADRTVIKNIAPHVDIFFYDIKTLDNEKHKSGTGVGNAGIIENARWLAGAGKKTVLRMPMIPGFNDNEKEVKSLVSFARELGLGPADTDLLQYNPLGEAKYERLGRPAEQRFLQPQSDEYFMYLKSLLRQ